MFTLRRLALFVVDASDGLSLVSCGDVDDFFDNLFWTLEVFFVFVAAALVGFGRSRKGL